MVDKRIFVLIGVLILIIGITAIFTTQVVDDESEHVEIVATMYALGFLAEEIGGDKVNVDLLIPENTEVHSWSPSSSDILKVSRSDMFVYNGAGLEPWVEGNLIPSISTDGIKLVETTKGLKLVESTEIDLTRLFIFDNDETNTHVYDIYGTDAISVTSLDFGSELSRDANVPSAQNIYGYMYLFVPDNKGITVLDTGLHGDHFHSPRTITTIDAEQPGDYAISHDNKKVAFAVNGEQEVLVINIDNPNIDRKYDIGDINEGEGTLIIQFDKDGLLYVANKNAAENENLRIIDTSTHDVVAEGNAGDSPYSSIYSKYTGYVYFTTNDGILKVSNTGESELIEYTHEGSSSLVESWVTLDGGKLVSLIGDDNDSKLPYSGIVVYDLVDEELVREVPIELDRTTDSDHDIPAQTLFLQEQNILAISDPEVGNIELIDIEDGSMASIQIQGNFPQSLRLVGNEDIGILWSVTSDGLVHAIDLNNKEVLDQFELEESLGNDLALAQVPVETPATEGDELYDPHTWISPYVALKQGQNIYESLVEIDPENEEYYTQRWNELKSKLEDLDQRYMEELAETEKDEIFVSHEAYGYLADRYGFTQAGVIGIEADEQPSSSAIAALVNRMIESETYVIYLDPIYSDAYMNTLKRNVEQITGQEVKVETLYLMTGEIDGLNYFEQMEHNLEVIKMGLEAK